jgi:Domain of unknown function (DUF5671)
VNEQQRLEQFVATAKEKGLSTTEIRELLASNGWSASDTAQAVYGEWAMVPTPDHPVLRANAGVLPHGATNEPISVVQNLSTRGFEYSIMFVSLLATAFSIGAILHAFVGNLFAEQTTTSDPYYSSSSDGIYSFAATVLLVTLPIFVVLFLRLKKAELADPSLKKDPSRKRMSHFTQFLAFLVGIGYIVAFFYGLINGTAADGGGGPGVGESFLQMLITLIIAGSIFGYLWKDEHATK